MKYLIYIKNIVPYIFIVILTIYFVNLHNKLLDRYNSINNKYEQLSKIVNIQKQETMSQRQLYKKLKQENKQLYKKIKKYKLTINNLTKVKIKYEKEITNLKLKVNHYETYDVVNFNKEFKIATVKGYMKANEIIGEPIMHIELIPKEQNVTIVNTDTGTIVDTSHGTAEINTYEHRQYNYEIIIGANTLGNIFIGAFKNNIGINIEYGTHNSIGVMYRKRW